MNQILIFIFGVVVGGITVSLIRANRRIVNPQDEKKKQNKEKILALFEVQDQVSNASAEQALGVSDATATRYLDELEKEGKIKQIGQTGRPVHYKKT